MECQVEANKEKCACESDCERRGICCECLKHHLPQNSLPMCMRDLDWLEIKK